MIIVWLSCLLFLSFSQNERLQSDSSQLFIETKSYEQLIVSQDTFMLEISYEDAKSNIPRSLKAMLSQMQISYLALQMGFANPSAFYSSDNIPLHFQHGISLQLKNNSHLSHQNFHSIAQVFSISRDTQFIVYFSEVQTTFSSNPNDKFCAQHLKNIIDLFMPCKNVAGIGAAVNQKTFFAGKRFAGLKLQWKIGQTIKLTFYLDKSTQEVKNYLKLSEQKRYLKRCIHFDKFSIQNHQIGKPSNLIHDKDPNKIPSIIYTSSISSEFNSNYYNPSKQLSFRINLSKLNQDIFGQNSMAETSRIKMIKARILLPEGFRIQKVSSQCLLSCGHIVQRIDSIVSSLKSFKGKPIFNIPTDSRSLNTQVTFSVAFSSSDSSIFQKIDEMQKTQSPQIQLKIWYKSHLKPFQKYQTVAGGGQEFSNIPLTVALKDNVTLMVLSHKNRNMFDRLLQPDFSIPFKAITFTVAIFGYLWISIWKAYYTQAQRK